LLKIPYLGILIVFLLLNSHHSMMDTVPNHTLIGENEEELMRLEEKIKMIEEFIQEINE